MSVRYLAVISLDSIFSRFLKPKHALEKIESELEERDRSFLMELIYGVLRRRYYLDWILSDFIKRPSGLSESTKNNLRVALYQLCFTRVPEWAVVDEAVSIEKRLLGKPALVNAALRNYLRLGRKSLKKPPRDMVKRISVMTSHPEWLTRRWISRLGYAEAEKLAMSNNETPPLTLRIDIDRDEALNMLAANGIEAFPTRYSPSGVIVKGWKVFDETKEDSAGRKRLTARNIPLPTSSFIVQDEAAQLVSWLLDPRPGEKILDACAAPGGKTTHIARLLKDNGMVLALDADETRIQKITENKKRLGLESIFAVAGDIRFFKSRQDFDRVLVDAPCSAIGVIKRNPDVRYRHKEEDLARFGKLQLETLNSSARFLKPGGVMVYSVCSTEPEEGEDVINAFLLANPDFSIIKADYDFLSVFAYEHIEGRVFYRTWPHKVGQETFEGYSMDGFFAARLRRDR